MKATGTNCQRQAVARLSLDIGRQPDDMVLTGQEKVGECLVAGLLDHVYRHGRQRLMTGGVGGDHTKIFRPDTEHRGA